MVMALFALALPAAAHAGALEEFVDVQAQGLSVAADAADGANFATTPKTLEVTLPAQAFFALLYWNGRDVPCPTDGGGNCAVAQPYKDQTVSFDGNTFGGVFVGAE